MALYFKDRIPDPIHGENLRYYDAVGSNGTAKLSDFKLVMKNNIPSGKSGDPVNAANLNFASGNVMFQESLPGQIHKGNLLSVAMDGTVVLSKTMRANAAVGPVSTTAMLANGFFRLSDTRLLLLYSDRMAVATLNFTNKTVSFGSYRTPGYQIARGTLLRNLDESATALYCSIDRSTGMTPAYRPTVYEITGTSVSAPAFGYYYDSSHINITNPASVGTSSFIACSYSGSYHVSLFKYENSAVSLVTQITIPGATGVMHCGTLFTQDKAAGKYLFIYTTNSGSLVGAVPITVTGNTVTVGNVQNLGLPSENLYNSNYVPSGMDCHSAFNGKIILVGYEPGWGTYGPAKIQILSLNQSGIVTKGTVQNLPLLNINQSTENPGAVSISYNKTTGKVYITGVDWEVNPRDACLLEMEINGVNFTYKKYRPFKLLQISNSDESTHMKTGAFENPAKPGEFLFVQGYDSGLLTDTAFWFGHKTDCVNPDNIIGIAIEEPDGYIRVQSSGKYLTGLFSNLEPGQLYTAGNNGSLIKYTGESDINPVGIATSPTDLQFFGAGKLR